MIAGVIPLSPVMTDLQQPVPSHTRNASTSSTSSVPAPTSLLVLAYSIVDTSFLHEATDDRTLQARKRAERDLVPEMVFLLGRMGDNKKALYLIIERLGDVNRVRLWFPCNHRPSHILP